MEIITNMDNIEESFKELVEGYEKASPEDKERGKLSAAKFAFRRLSDKQKKELQHA